MNRWNHQKWGTLADPIHKSHLKQIVGPFGCLRAFQYDMQHAAEDGLSKGYDSVSGKSAAGTASHETIARALGNEQVRAQLLEGQGVSAESVRKVFDQELERARDGRELVWYGKRDNPDKVLADRVQMVTGLLGDLHNHVAQIELIEAGFIARVGDYWVSGQTDLVYRPADDPSGLGMADWKSGAQKPHPIELDHGFESGIYASAVHEGVFVPRDVVEMEGYHCEAYQGWRARGPFDIEVVGRSYYKTQRTCLDRVLIEVGARLDAGDLEAIEDYPRFGVYPSHLHYVHMGDYVPYQKKGTKTVDRPEDLRFYGLEEPGRVSYVAGDRRGPAWLEMRRTEDDVPRLEHLLRAVVSTVRMGRFFESVGEKCTRCPFKEQCLTAGYAPRGEEKKDIDEALRGLDLDDHKLGDVA
ncbi:MAG: PD-(D/E)XK nuclease family protein [Gammaproteobacteria bacterium]|nr:PD-(D/E)XK nuclease family protein [Gammaproteobacteria bacterium]NIR85192.1 PD-(D/E)XK nuclease family protein [Gammaproteobacteria bacterium]NIU06241.1 PD-(D/E)XK nuclease family protein [Gammaproteobacteria bacterium]NIX87514.1 hypothetical protein [Gammaproteobacteria bacterium]